MDTTTKIITATIPILARDGYEATSIRKIAAACELEPSVIYYYFSDKAALLRNVRTFVNTQLDAALTAMPESKTARDMLQQRIAFSIEHAEEIVCLLQYFLAAKADFPMTAGGFVPERAYKHIYDVVIRGIKEKIFASDDPLFDAKITVHLINGFLLEYYPHKMTKREEVKLAEKIAKFIERSLQK